MNKEQFAQDGSVVMAICASLGLPVPLPEEMKEEEILLMVACSSMYLLKRALSGREDAEHINYLWIEAEREMIKQFNAN
jgi:hypothetical protein